jgi:hypothetical protein
VHALIFLYLAAIVQNLFEVINLTRKLATEGQKIYGQEAFQPLNLTAKTIRMNVV